MRLLNVLFSLVVWPTVVVLTVIFSSCAVLISLLAPRGRPGLYLARIWARLLLVIAGVRFRVEGGEKLDLTKSYVIMANHESLIDVPAIMAALPSRLGGRILAKESLFRIPFIGWAMRRLGFLPVDRAHRSTAPELFQKAMGTASGGNSIILYPEETRTQDGRLLPFKRGGFLIALKAGFPILPVGIEGARISLPPGEKVVRPGTVVTVRIGVPIPTAGLGVSA
ncbi:MAG: 1-acyl-sn-glycerol-3-phosphate acyltransferase, partial [Acidobacteria bacterium]|nr:1-acyl-sn-glycerol-3-phosphate acyltransferase [Acidobacteriota bacterium]